MAKNLLSRTPKIHIARALLGAAIAASAFAALPAQADSPVGAAAAGAVPAAVAAKQQPPVEGTGDVKPTAAQVLTLAKQQIGTTENSLGGGTKFQKWYMNSQRAAETIARDGGNRQAYLNAAWCAMFVSWVGENTGARSTIGWDAYTVTHAKWFKDNARWGVEPKEGSVVFFAWNGSKSLTSIEHVGFVVKDNGDGTLTTVEGNTGNGKVEERVRPKSQVVGYGYPEYRA
ncbi:CHAP domain-containing protein [Nonomuraea longicatena]|uniref:Peptidase C51 domain-containing protein n=1 Tax=Nonomuraea longicatena TaxID=83682 RepID=A0ABP4B517_9ACTN